MDDRQPTTPCFSAGRYVAVLCGLLLVAGSTTGCGDGRTPVSGQVTYQGQPLEQGRVTFLPESGRPAFGEIRQGRFELTSLEPGDGVPPGTYRVAIQSDAPQQDAFADAVSLIPEKYRRPETSGLSATVAAGEANEFTFALE